ncbi:Imm8 family immunity protein [Gimesia fumaroli]|uniref:Uncharacterized protein n=1 Tax=Gimesia fumaroli TaxID=2527976 RepID=A0A518I4I2_9PLAN|nr:Imm8 family immunity protein [Gimesia fumaroli]QDV48019.1 hypothetical protein Enr17x_00280 [Gimesia fumaroli]
MLEVLSFGWYEHELDWAPSDPYRFGEWATLFVGENNAGNYYELQVCTASMISQLVSKQHLFVLDEWVSLEQTISKLNQFIRETLTHNLKPDPYRLLGEHWFWEYEGM